MSTESLESIKRLTSDITSAGRLLSHKEARFLIDYYYIVQNDRKRASAQTREAEKDGEPSLVLSWLAGQSNTLENQVKRMLDAYTQAHKIGMWLRTVDGIGPVIAAGLLAHIDISKAPTAGHIWSYAGLDPKVVWEKGAKRPWNAQLKVLCWHAGNSFMKLSGKEGAFYGKIYKERKQYEIDRNDAGTNKELAASLLSKFSKSTDAYKWLSEGKLPPAQIDARARRYAVKMFLSHLHSKWYEIEYGKPAPVPFAISHLNHVHLVHCPY